MQNSRHKNQSFSSNAQPNPIDLYVGGRLRKRRTMLGLSQEALAAALGLTFQQVQKYERGINRIGASRLFDLARALGVDVDYFYQDMSEDLKEHAAALVHPLTRELQIKDPELLADSETQDLVRAYYRIGDPAVRRRVHQLAKALAAVSPLLPPAGE